MREEALSFTDEDGKIICYYKWSPESKAVRGIVQISHGISETASRYQRFAAMLTEHGYVVYANDHRGHGRTAGSIDSLGVAGKDGFNWMVRDLKQLGDIAKAENPAKSLFLFAHSMGSHIGQKYITLYGDSIDGVILSGTSASLGLLQSFGSLLIAAGRCFRGDNARAYLMNRVGTGSFNKDFQPVKTDFDWLSRDEAEVQKYIHDEYCGAVPTFGFYRDYFDALKTLHKESTVKGIPKELPVLVISGEKDPVGLSTKSVKDLLELYKRIGLKRVEHKFYKDARHELLNETNRDEVMADVLAWMEEYNNNRE